MTADIDLAQLNLHTVIRWEDPPARKPRNKEGGVAQSWAVVRMQLRQRPNTWALIGEGVNSGIANLFRSNGYEGCTRNPREVNGSIVGDVYARYVSEVNQ